MLRSSFWGSQKNTQPILIASQPVRRIGVSVVVRLRGLPPERSVDARPSWQAVLSVHLSSPYGRARLTDNLSLCQQAEKKLAGGVVASVHRSLRLSRPSFQRLSKRIRII